MGCVLVRVLVCVVCVVGGVVCVAQCAVSAIVRLEYSVRSLE